MAAIFTASQKEHIQEFFKTRIPDVRTDYIFLNSGQEDLGYFLDGYLFAHHYAELDPLSFDKQVGALMSRLVSEDGLEFDYVEVGFTIKRLDQDSLKDKFGYNPDTPIEEYRRSERNIDVIQQREREKEALLQLARQEEFLKSLDREKFLKTLELIQKYSVEEVLVRPPIYHSGDELRLEALQNDLEGFDYKPLDDFIEAYIDPNYDIGYLEFPDYSPIWDELFASDIAKYLKTDHFIALVKENGIVDNIPVVEPWQREF